MLRRGPSNVPLPLYCGVVLIMVLAWTLTGCAGKPAPQNRSLIQDSPAQPAAQSAATSAPARRTVALVMKTLTNPFFVEMEKGARRAETEFGINLIVKTGSQETSIDQQIAIVEELIQAKVDAIVIAPGSSTELIPVLVKAQKAGIPVINIDNRLDVALSKEKGLVDVPFISVDNEKGAYQSTQYLTRKLKAPAEVAILEGIREAKNADDRKNGAQRAFKEAPGVSVVASETAHWKIDEAYDVTAKIFERYPNVQAVFCANDMMALGTIKYLSDAKKTGVLVAAYDALDEAKAAIRDGKLVATIDQRAADQGYLGIQYAMRALKGEKLPPETLIDVQVVSAENVQ
jgi:ribose transport system substrate-binding protein